MTAGDIVSGAAARHERDWAELAYRAAFPLIFLYAMVAAIPNVFVVDGYVYVAMVHALVTNGSLAVENGYDWVPSDRLAFVFFKPVDGQLMAQYPHGWAFLAAPFYWLGELRGLFLLNALATLLTLWLIRRTGALLLTDRAGLVAALLYAYATYAFDYAGAAWPHAVAVATIAGATLAAAHGWRTERLWPFGVAGLLAGLGINVRVDVLFVIPALGLWTLGATRRPYAAAALLAAGLVPGFAAATLLNWMKFGIALPVTYGNDNASAKTSFGFWAETVPILVALAAGALALGLPRVRRMAGRPAVIAAAAALGLGVLFVTGIGAKLAEGVLGLAVDLRFLSESHGLKHVDGDVLIYGLAKKTLLQSLPFLPVLLLLAPLLARGGDERKALLLPALAAVFILLPFAYGRWDGGYANHMRYFLHLMPALCLLAAPALLRLVNGTGRAALTLACALGLPLLALACGIAFGRAPVFILQRDLPNVVAAGVALTALWLLVRPSPPARGAARGAVLAGLALAVAGAWVFDLASHQDRRARNMHLTEVARTFPERALLHTIHATWAFERARLPQTFVARAKPGTYYDPALIEAALAENRAIYVQHPYIADLIAKRYGTGLEQVAGSDDPTFQLFRIVP